MGYVADSFAVINYKIGSTFKPHYYKGKIADSFAAINYKVG